MCSCHKYSSPATHSKVHDGKYIYTRIFFRFNPYPYKLPVITTHPSLQCIFCATKSFRTTHVILLSEKHRQMSDKDITKGLPNEEQVGDSDNDRQGSGDSSDEIREMAENDAPVDLDSPFQSTGNVPEAREDLPSSLRGAPRELRTAIRMKQNREVRGSYAKNDVQTFLANFCNSHLLFSLKILLLLIERSPYVHIVTLQYCFWNIAVLSAHQEARETENGRPAAISDRGIF